MLKKKMVLFLITKELEFQKRESLIAACLLQVVFQKMKLILPLRKSGSAALDIAYVAAGRYDGYFQNDLNLWDIAAGIIILKEAGGYN